MNVTTDEADLSIYRLMEYQSTTLALCDELATAGAALDEALTDFVFGQKDRDARLIAWRRVAACRQTLRDLLARHQAFKRQ